MTAAFTWDAHTRASMREHASRATGPFLRGGAVVKLLDLLEAAEARAARADELQARLDRGEALHRPVARSWGMGCAHCLDRDGQPVSWPCATAEALSGRSAP